MDSRLILQVFANQEYDNFPFRKGELFRAVVLDQGTYEYLTLEEIKLNLYKYSNYIYHISEPNDEMYLIALERNYTCFDHIQNPSETICFDAIKRHPPNLLKIYNPSEHLYITAVSRSGVLLQFVLNPSLEIIRKALGNSGMALAYVTNQTSELCWIAIKNSPEAIGFVKEQTVDMCLYVLDQVKIRGLSPKISAGIRIVPFGYIDQMQKSLLAKQSITDLLVS